MAFKNDSYLTLVVDLSLLMPGSPMKLFWVNLRFMAMLDDVLEFGLASRMI